MSDEQKRIINQDTDTALSSGDYIMVDSQSEGTRKFDLGAKLAEIDEAIQSGGSGGGISTEEKSLILTLFSKAAYAEDDAGDVYDALAELWAVYSVTWSGSGYTHSNTSASIEGGKTFTSTITASGGHTISTVTATMGGVTVQGAWNNGTVTIPNVTGDIVITVTTAQATVSSISAVYIQSGTVYATDSLDSLKSDLVVTATYTDQTTSVIPSAEYDLSGTLTTGTSTITVSYGGKTTTFNVTVSESPKSDMNGWVSGIAYSDIEYVQNSYVSGASGSINSYNGWDRTGYIPCNGASTIYFPALPNADTSTTSSAYFYTEEKSPIEKMYLYKNKSATITVPSTAYYFIFSEASGVVQQAIVDGVIPYA